MSSSLRTKNALYNFWRTQHVHNIHKPILWLENWKSWFCNSLTINWKSLLQIFNVYMMYQSQQNMFNTFAICLVTLNARWLEMLWNITRFRKHFHWYSYITGHLPENISPQFRFIQLPEWPGHILIILSITTAVNAYTVN